MTEEQGERIIALLERIAAAVEVLTWEPDGRIRWEPMISDKGTYARTDVRQRRPESERPS